MNMWSEYGVYCHSKSPRCGASKELFMKRLLILLALAGLGTAGGCGKEDDDDNRRSVDAGLPDGATGAGDGSTARADGAVPLAVKINEVGAACTADSSCSPAGAKCATSVGDTALQAGYCTATCSASAECGGSGGCPIGDVTSGLGIMFDISAFLPIPSYCWKKCAPSDPNACREGYSCKAALDIIPAEQRTGIIGLALNGNAALRVTYCLPPIQLPAPRVDGGTPDAGRTDAGATDAGLPVDSGVVDSGVVDSGAADAATQDAGDAS